jgi:Flp pilus assembly secretin CpaC
MRSLLACVLLIGSAAAAAAVEAPSDAAEPVAVLIDHAKVLRLPERTQTVILGNPAVADVSVQKNGILVLTARATAAPTSSL